VVPKDAKNPTGQRRHIAGSLQEVRFDGLHTELERQSTSPIGRGGVFVGQGIADRMRTGPVGIAPEDRLSRIRAPLETQQQSGVEVKYAYIEVEFTKAYEVHTGKMRKRPQSCLRDRIVELATKSGCWIV